MTEGYKYLNEGDQIIVLGGRLGNQFTIREIITLLEDGGTDGGIPYCKSSSVEKGAFAVKYNKWRKLNPFDGNLTKENWVHKEDMPDEETHNRVRSIFIDVFGKPSFVGNGLYEDRGGWEALGVYCVSVCWWNNDSGKLKPEYRLHPQQLFDYFDEQEEELPMKHNIDDVVSVEMTKGQVILVQNLLSNLDGFYESNLNLDPLLSHLDEISETFINPTKKGYNEYQPTFSLVKMGYYEVRKEFEEDLIKFFTPEPTEKELRQQKIKELKDKIEELEDLDKN